MARTRRVHPDFFADERLAELPALTRLAFLGLLTIADREGRIEDRPARIRALVMPYDAMDMGAALSELRAAGAIERYEERGTSCIQIVGWADHQRPHQHEVASKIPEKTADSRDLSRVTRRIDTPTNTNGAPWLAKGSLDLDLVLDPDLTAATRPKGVGSDLLSLVVSPPDPDRIRTAARVPRAKASPNARTAPPSDFDRFMAAYPNKVARGAAEKAWAAMAPPLNEVLEALDWQRLSEGWTKDGGQYIPHPATWIRAKRWMDVRPELSAHREAGWTGRDANMMDEILAFKAGQDQAREKARGSQ